jgi:hypothetical protein
MPNSYGAKSSVRAEVSGQGYREPSNSETTNELRVTSHDEAPVLYV